MRSRLELRRLAYRAPRNEAAREVLHDALLETYEGYSLWIEDAHNQAWAKKTEMAVMFLPLKRAKRHRLGLSLFTLTPSNGMRTKVVEQAFSVYANPDEKHAVVVYRAAPRPRWGGV